MPTWKTSTNCTRTGLSELESVYNYSHVTWLVTDIIASFEQSRLLNPTKWSNTPK